MNRKLRMGVRIENAQYIFEKTMLNLNSNEKNEKEKQDRYLKYHSHSWLKCIHKL